MLEQLVQVRRLFCVQQCLKFWKTLDLSEYFLGKNINLDLQEGMSLALREMRVDQVKGVFSLVDFLLFLGDFLLLLGVDQVKRVLSVVDFLEMTIVTNQSLLW